MVYTAPFNDLEPLLIQI